MVREVVLNQKFERHGCMVTDGAESLKAILGDAVHDRSKDLVLDTPPLQQEVPGMLGITMSGNPAILRVGRTGVLALNGRGDKALPVVGRRVEEMSEDLLAGPLARAPGQVSQVGGDGGEPLFEGVNLGSEGEGKRCGSHKPIIAG